MTIVRTAKALAAVATLTGLLLALFLVAGTMGMGVSPLPPQNWGAALLISTPLVQITLVGLAAHKEESGRKAAATWYGLAVLALLPAVLLLISR